MAAKNTNTEKNSSVSRKNRAAQTTSGQEKQTVEVMSKKLKDEEETAAGIRREIAVLISFAVMALLLLSNFHLCGKLGDALSYFMFGLFGIFSYTAPVLLFAAAVFYLANRGNKKAVLKLWACIAFICFLLALIHIIWKPYDGSLSVLGSFAYCGKNRVGGGLIGAGIGYGLSMLIGFVGAFIVIILVMAITFVLVTERSIVKAVEKRSRRVYETAKEDIEKHREADRRQENLNRARKRARGVARATLPGVDDSEPEMQAAVSGRKTEEPVPDRKPGEEESQSFTENHTDEIFRPGREETIRRERDFDILSSGEKPAYEPQETDEDYFHQIEAALELNEPFDENERGGQDDSAKDAFLGEAAFYEQKVPEPVFGEKKGSAAYDKPEDFFDIEGDTGKKNRVMNSGERISPETVASEIKASEKAVSFRLPPVSLLQKGNGKAAGNHARALEETSKKLEDIFRTFGVNVKVTNYSQGPSVTRYELQPELGTKVSKITSLTDDIKLNLAVSDIRIEAPIPGKAAVGIEVPNETRNTVYLRDLIESAELAGHKSKIAFAAGKDIAGKVVVADIAKMPHMLIAGTTGSGKSVFTNSIIMSILFRATPDEVKLIIVDPKVVEFGVYNGIPHLLIPVVTDPRKAAGALGWAVAEMSSRYKKFAEWNVRDLKGYNEKIKTAVPAEGEEPLKPLPQIVIIIDELADLMMVAAKEVEESICRLAQLARAAGIHLVIATQRPSVDVVTGLIKANIPSRVALLVSSGVDSRTIIDMNGAEKLLGNGDMLFYPSGYVKPVRLQGAFVSDGEVQKIVSFLTSQGGEVKYDEQITNRMEAPLEEQAGQSDDERDAYFMDAARFVIEKDKASVSMLQRVFKIGFNRAARIVDQLAAAGVIGEDEGTKPRKILMTMEEFEANFGSGNEK